MQKPVSIRKFDLFYLGAVALGVVNTLLNFSMLESSATEQVGPDLAQHASSIAIGSVVLSTLFSLLFWFLISKLRIEFIKWLLLLFLAWSAVALPTMLAEGFGLPEIVALASVVLQTVAVWYLFRPDAKAWFQARRGAGDFE